MHDSVEGQLPKKMTLRGWMFLAAMLMFAAIGFWGRITHNGALGIIGFGPILVLTGFAVVWSKYKAARDPEFAARLATQQAKAKVKQRARLHEIPWLLAPFGLLLVLGPVVNPLLAREPALAGAIAHMSPPHQRMLWISLAIWLVFGARIFWWLARRPVRRADDHL